jgi:hypothetical protein
MKPNVYSAGDYAGMISGRHRFYYGYEEIWKNPNDPDGEQWAFVAYKDGKEKMRIPTTQLDDLGNFGSPESYLLAGIALYLNR